MLLLPHHYEFAETLANLPFFYQEAASKTCEVMHLIQSNPNHLPELATANRLKEYLCSGEINDHVEFVDGYLDSELTDENENSSTFWELGDEWLGSI
ncbi:hypothetical protein [Microcoleus sp. B4-C1]|uniref:hypothetical protein n=1 Tax=Microcoleus sp. B4-C1 TaxID=2818660 RepID=UPI002FCE6E3A